MYEFCLPLKNRPDIPYRKVNPGIDLPGQFLSDLKAIEDKLYVIWHPYRCLWEDPLINSYEGSIDDPRYVISEQYGQLCFGFALTDGLSNPIPDNSWHIWRDCEFGWAHILKISSPEPSYLNTLISRLYRNAVLSNHGAKRMRREMQEEQEEILKKNQKKGDDMWSGIQEENKSLMKTAYENFEFGRVKPTNKTKDVIYSYKGQSNRTKIERPYTDREGGLILPDKYRSD